MFDQNRFLSELEEIYAGNTEHLEEFLQSGLKEAQFCGDKGSMLLIRNELMGYYREMSRYEDCERTIEQAVRIAEEMGLQGTVSYAVMLLNIGTAWRVMGKYEEAEECYGQSFMILNEEVQEPDYRKAALYNNRSILYANTGRLKEAKRDLESAMELILQLDEAETEVAITHVNVGNICIALQELEEGMEHMKEAVRIFGCQEGKKDPHFASALSGLGEAYFRNGELQKAEECYEKALGEIRSNYGENDSYRITMRNLETVRSTKARMEAIREQNQKGMEISRAYYEAFGKPLIERKYGEYAGRIAAGLAGEGSECMGYDDEYSVDHDYGPGFCLWLTAGDYEKIGEQLRKDYEQLPGEFMGFPARNTTEQGAFRVGVFSMDDFFRRYTGYPEAPDPDTKAGIAAWRGIGRSALGTVTNGQVFEDPLGEFTRRREAFLAYPEKLRIFELAQELGRMAQSGQYNYGRMRKRKDIGAVYLCKYQFVEGAAEAAYLLNHCYPPFYKWKLRGMEGFRYMAGLKEKLVKLMGIEPDMKVSGTDRAEVLMEEICREFVRELNRQGLTESREGFLEVQKEVLMKRCMHDV